MAANSKVQYDEISKAKIAENRNLVISSCSKGGYTLAQQLKVSDTETSSSVSVFLKGAIHIKDKEALINVRDAINVVLNTEDVEWDNNLATK